MEIIRVFDNTTPHSVIRSTLEELFDSLISHYYSEDKVISTASSKDA